MIFFQFIVIRLIIQISKRKEVDRTVILESINGYLMMGMLFSTLIIVLIVMIPVLLILKKPE